MKKLSRTQQDALEYGASKRQRDGKSFLNGGTLDKGWFYPQHTTRGSIDFFCRWQTLASLCGLGLFEYKVTSHWQDRRGNWRVDKSYRISQAGIDYLASQLAPQPTSARGQGAAA